jgi:Asp-tRNA(Asn)/Glu-tRNA(Gln) amidotransferase A subunit family amidase
MSNNRSLETRILDMDAAALLEAYQNGETTPGEALEVYIRHQEGFNDSLNLVVEKRYDTAREEAKAYDAELAKGGSKGKLFGIPISMKEAYDVEGMHTTGALSHYKGRLRDNTATVVKRLQEEGAVIISKTNTPALCFCQETDNKPFGRANNPWNPEYTTGGSSGGEAGVIAVGGAAAGFGSDIGGSIRIPSHFNGVVGFKPGARQFPMDGHLPNVTLENQERMLGFGPIVKSVRDAANIYSIIHPSFQAPGTWDLPTNLQIVSFDSCNKTRCTAETVALLQKAREGLKEKGARVRIDLPEMITIMKDVPLFWQLGMSEDGGLGILKDAYPHLQKGSTLSYLRVLLDWIKAKIGMEAFNHPYLSWALFGAWLFKPGRKKKQEMNAFFHDNLRVIEEMLGANGVFLVPVFPTPAKKHGRIYRDILAIDKPFRWSLPFISLANFFGLPALVVPCGRSKEGLPIGLQVISTIGNEGLVFKVGAFLERCFGGYKRNRDYDG